jgi:hypothetical protein
MSIRNPANASHRAPRRPSTREPRRSVCAARYSAAVGQQSYQTMETWNFSVDLDFWDDHRFTAETNHLDHPSHSRTRHHRKPHGTKGDED